MKTVVIVGASYAGLYAVKKLAKQGNIKVIIFDKNRYHYVQVESYGFASNKYDADKVTIDIPKYLDTLHSNIEFNNQKVSSFCADSKEVVAQDGTKFVYDYLIIATGSLTNFPIQVPNIAKYSDGVKTLVCANNIKQTFEEAINRTIYHKNTSDKQVYNLVIGGAGLSGVEIAAEMAIVLEKQTHLMQDCSYEINIIIVDGMKTVLPNMDERLVTACEERLEKLGIKIYLGSFIKDVDEKKIHLMNSTVIDYDYFIFTGGVKAVTLNSPKVHEVNKLNQYVVDQYLQLKNEKDIFAIGDTAQIILDGKYIPPSAQLAIKTGEYVAHYIKMAIKDKPIEQFTAKSNGTLISLGGEYAIGLLYDKFFVKGYIAYKIKKLVTYLHKVKFV